MPQDARPGQGWNFDNSYARLPEQFAVRVAPAPAPAPRLMVLNGPLALELGLDPQALADEPGLFTGNTLPPGAEPLALAYAGHQFGSFTMLGDGRAILLGEQLTPAGRRVDIQLKGSGRTPFSRGGDGRAALGPMLREHLVSEAMHHLGIPTSRSLAVAATGAPVQRETPLDGAVLTRVAASHIRVGTFEYLAARGEPEALRLLADYTLGRHHSGLPGGEDAPLALLRASVERQAALVARWLHVGFVHGVMNTDNMALSGETMDYGPCAFLDAYDPDAVFSSIDLGGRYAYGNQPHMAQWNLARLAEALLPVLHPEPEQALRLAQDAVGAFSGLFREAWLSGMRAKLGLFTQEAEDLELARDLLSGLKEARADYTIALRGLGAETPEEPQTDTLARWRQRWLARLGRQPQTPQQVRERMRAHNPALIPRNHLVEAALAAATGENDLGPFRRLCDALARPFEEPAEYADYRLPPPATATPYRTFCGT